MSSDNLLSRKNVDAQYRPRGYGLSPGLQRARAPFRVRNAVTGIIVGTFAVSVWAYSIRAVKQDTFEDVDEEAKAMLSSRVQQEQPGSSGGLGKPSSSVPPPTTVIPVVQTESMTDSTPAPLESPRPVGILAPLLEKTHPRLLDPRRKTIVWGAPPVDSIGRLSISRTRSTP